MTYTVGISSETCSVSQTLYAEEKQDTLTQHKTGKKKNTGQRRERDKRKGRKLIKS